jgi:hypothetical protein
MTHGHSKLCDTGVDQGGILDFFKIDGTANPADAMSKVLYRILFAIHFNRMQDYNGSPHATHPVFRPNPNDNTADG